MNGIPVGGSPFPVFFSPPTLAEIAACLLAAKRMGSSPEAALKVMFFHEALCVKVWRRWFRMEPILWETVLKNVFV